MLKTSLHPVALKDERHLHTLVENRSIYTLEHCELNVFETHQEAHNVHLRFGDLVLTSMLRGKKVMHLFGKEGFEYLPGESVLVPPDEVMRIDFPEAERQNPTQCIALAISPEQIRETLSMLNDKYPKAELNDEWHINEQFFHLINTNDLTEVINRLIRIGIKEQSKEKDLFGELALRELLLRLMQTQARTLLETNCRTMSSHHRLAHVITYIKEHLDDKIDLNRLSEQACMSRANFFRKFKQELGVSPGDFILQERIKLAKTYLQTSGHSVTEVCFMCGFQNLHHFIRAFKKELGMTPKAYQLDYAKV